LGCITGQPINPLGTTAKCPSICQETGQGYLFITYQSNSFPFDGIAVAAFYFSILDNVNIVDTYVEYVDNFDPSFNYKPVIASAGGSGTVVYDMPPTSSSGLKGFVYRIENNQITHFSNVVFPSNFVDQNSSNPSIVSGCQRTYLVFEQAKTSIRFYAWGSVATCSTTISTGSGTTYNLSPTISLLNCDYPVVSWIGATSGYYPTKLITKVGNQYGSTWPTSINAVNGFILSASNSSSSAASNTNTLITWSQLSSPYTYSRWQKRVGTQYSTPSSLSPNGSWVQASADMYFTAPKALVYNNQTSPSYFSISSTNFVGNINTTDAGTTWNGKSNVYLGKITEEDTIITFGRSGVASINDVEFVFEIGDILVGDSVIRFIEIPDTLVYNSANELNQHTRTNNFTLTPNTNFYFSNIYRVV